MKIITAIEKYDLNQFEIPCFLAGGITNCSEWQNEIIKGLNEKLKDDYEECRLVLFNPRRENFPINDPNAALEQINWEFEYLEKCQIFSMFFDGTAKSDQPICFYELGRNIERMKQKFPKDWWMRIIVSVNSNFKRSNDVIIQTSLTTNNKVKVNVSNSSDDLIQKHIDDIYSSFKYACMFTS